MILCMRRSQALFLHRPIFTLSFTLAPLSHRPASTPWAPCLSYPAPGSYSHLYSHFRRSLTGPRPHHGLRVCPTRLRAHIHTYIHTFAALSQARVHTMGSVSVLPGSEFVGNYGNLLDVSDAIPLLLPPP